MKIPLRGWWPDIYVHSLNDMLGIEGHPRPLCDSDPIWFPRLLTYAPNGCNDFAFLECSQCWFPVGCLNPITLSWVYTNTPISNTPIWGDYMRIQWDLAIDGSCFYRLDAIVDFSMAPIFTVIPDTEAQALWYNSLLWGSPILSGITNSTEKTITITVCWEPECVR